MNTISLRIIYLVFIATLLIGCKHNTDTGLTEVTDDLIDFYDIANMDSIYEYIYKEQPVLVGIAKDLGEELLYVSNFICDLKQKPIGYHDSIYDSLFIKIWRAEKIDDKPLLSPKYINDLCYRFWIAGKPIWDKLNINQNDTISISLYDFWGVGNNYQFISFTNGEQAFLACAPSLIRYVAKHTYLSQYVTLTNSERTQIIDSWDRDSLLNSDKRFRLEHDGEIGGGGLCIMSARILFSRNGVTIDTISYNSFKSKGQFIRHFESNLNN